MKINWPAKILFKSYDFLLLICWILCVLGELCPKTTKKSTCSLHIGEQGEKFWHPKPNGKSSGTVPASFVFTFCLKVLSLHYWTYIFYHQTFLLALFDSIRRNLWNPYISLTQLSRFTKVRIKDWDMEVKVKSCIYMEISAR